MSLDKVLEALSSGLAAEAVITPMSKQKTAVGKSSMLYGIDYKSFEKISSEFIEAGGNGIVFTGTTGESSTLSDEEQLNVIKTGTELIKSSFPNAVAIAGTGSNDTDHAVYLSKEAEKLGADALLIVSPYYNKPSQEGYMHMIMEIAGNTNVPLILYEIPGRAVFHIEAQTLRKLKDSCPESIIALKDAGGNTKKSAEYYETCPDVTLLSGDDARTYEIMDQFNGKGVISVVSHIAPTETINLVRMYMAGEKEKAKQIQELMAPLIEAMFCYGNPASVKTAMALQGRISPVARSPILTAQQANKGDIVEKITAALDKYKTEIAPNIRKIC